MLLDRKIWAYQSDKTTYLVKLYLILHCRQPKAEVSGESAARRKSSMEDHKRAELAIISIDSAAQDEADKQKKGA